MLTKLQTPKMGLHFINIGKTIKLKSEFKEGGIVVFRSTSLNLNPTPTPSGNDNTNINIMRGDNFLLHISIRRRENAFVFACKPAGGNWSHDERRPLGEAFKRKQTSITVCDHGDSFQVLIDYHTIIYYKKRIAGNADSFSYLVDAISSPLSNPLAVDIYSSLAGMIPAGEAGARGDPADADEGAEDDTVEN